MRRRRCVCVGFHVASLGHGPPFRGDWLEIGALRRLHHDEKCDGRDQDCAREKKLEADDGGLLRRLFGLIVGSLDIGHCTLDGRARPAQRRGAQLTAVDVALDSPVRHEVVDDLLDDAVGKLMVSLLVWIAVTVPLPNIGCEI